MTEPQGARRPHPIEDLYVGYRPTPSGERRLLRRLVPLLLLTLWLAGGIWASTFQSPGDGTWDSERPVLLEGLLLARPYARILVADPATPTGMRTVMLVREGKR